MAVSDTGGFSATVDISIYLSDSISGPVISETRLWFVTLSQFCSAQLIALIQIIDITLDMFRQFERVVPDQLLGMVGIPFFDRLDDSSGVIFDDVVSHTLAPPLIAIFVISTSSLVSLPIFSLIG